MFAVRDFRCERMRDQVAGITYSDGTPAVTMSCDAAGRPLEIGNAVATMTFHATSPAVTRQTRIPRSP